MSCRTCGRPLFGGRCQICNPSSSRVIGSITATRIDHIGDDYREATEVATMRAASEAMGGGETHRPPVGVHPAAPSGAMPYRTTTTVPATAPVGAGAGAAPGDRHKYCIFCATRLPASARFCSECGRPTSQPPKPRCQGCGSELMPGARFCADCGRPSGRP
mmetsp:Transcript_27684/g.36968  ORF Transcript_27684/g.36968 Transcript_27684/m.36968 type:complete len:161 (-) Transcript_27684:60-542(-)